MMRVLPDGGGTSLGPDEVPVSVVCEHPLVTQHGMDAPQWGVPSAPSSCQVPRGGVDVRMSWNGMECVWMIGTGEEGRDEMSRLWARASAR